MKRIFLLCLLMVAFGTNAWAQKKITPLAKALTGNVTPLRTPKQLLEETRLFIGQNGHRPRQAFYENAMPMPFSYLTPQQQKELRLGRDIAALFKRAQSDPALDTPTVQKLRLLVEQFPNRQPAPNADTLLTQLRAFIKKNGRQPRKIFYLNGRHVRYAQLPVEQKQECQLAQAIYRLTHRADPNPPAALEQIRQLLRQYPTAHSSPLTSHVVQQLPQVLEETKIFIAQHHRRPRTRFFKNGYEFPDEELTPAEQEEKQLGRHIARALLYAKRYALVSQLPQIKELRALVTPYNKKALPAPSVSEVLERTQQFISQHGHRPKGAFIQHNRPLSLAQLTPQQAKEVQLAGNINRVFQKDNERKFSDEEKITVQTLRELVNSYPNKRVKVPKDKSLLWQNVLARLEQYIDAHGRPPRSDIRKGSLSLTMKELSAEQAQEIRLGRQARQILNEAKATGQEDQPIFVQIRQRLKSRLSKKPQEDIAQLIQQVRQFIQIHHRRPRHVIFKNGQSQKNESLSPKQLEEVHLGRKLAQVLANADPARPDPQLTALQELIEPYSQSKQLDLSQLAAQLEQFIQLHQHRPHINFSVGLRLSAEQEQERLLGQRCYALIWRAKHNHEDITDPALQKIMQLWQETPL